MSPYPLMTPKEAAAYLQLAPGTLKKWRWLRKGPKFHQLGHKTIRYIREELDAWMGVQNIPKTTAEAREAFLIEA